MNESPVGVGVIGYGLFGFHHSRAVAAGSNTRLLAIAAKSDASRDRASEDHPEATIYEDYRALLKREDIELVHVVAPNQLHFEIAAAALEHGKHLLLEKPMALSVAECDQLIESANQQSLVLAIGHELRMSSLWGSVRTLIDAGKIGRVQHVLIELSRFPYREGSEGWRYDIDRVGSWILEEPIHFFDLARWYLSDSGEPTSVYARANGRRPEQPELKDNFTAMVHHDDGAYAVVTQTLAAFGHHQTAKVVGTEGTIWARWSAADARSERPQFGLQYGLGENVIEMQLDMPAGELIELSAQIAAIAKAVRSGGAPPCTGADGRWSTLLCLASEASVAEGAIVQIDDFLKR